MESLEIIDGSNDKKYFTIIPNSIVNGSDHWEQSLYLVMKRIAGENGTCWASTRTLAEKMGCSPTKVAETIKKLEKREWVKFVGKKDGKTAPAREYKIVDIWHENIEKYRDCPLGGHSKTVHSTDNTVHTVDTHCPLHGQKNKQYKEETIKNIIPHKKFSSIKDIQEFDIIEISEKYHVSLGFVRMQLETLKNYCESKGRIYKNYKAALRNFVLGDMKRMAERSSKDGNKRAVDARNI